VTPGPNILALREQLAIMVSTGKSKEAIVVQLTQEQVKRSEAKDVEKSYKRYETLKHLLRASSRCTPGRLPRLCR